jgi:hypothetical protein
MEKISLLIFSKDRDISKKVKKYKKYFDEVVIIDSSNEKIRKKLEKLKNKKVKYIWLPPLGIVELYYMIGLKECKYDWIFHIDDDETISKSLLRNLREIVKKAKVFKIRRKYKNGFSHETLFRLFNKKYIYPTGLIHYTWASKTKNFLLLPENFYIFHHERTENPVKKFEKYIFTESLQVGTKILDLINDKYITWSSLYEKRRKIFKTIFKLFSNFGKIGFFLSLIFYIFGLHFFRFVYKRIKLKSALKDSFVLIREVFNNFHYKYLIYIFQHKFGVYKFLGLDSLEKFKKISKKLNLGSDSLENLKKLYNFALKYYYRWQKGKIYFQ